MKNYNIKEFEEKLKRCKDIDLSEVNIDEIDDLNEIRISRRKSKEERILDFLTQAKNPYVFKVNGKLVKMSFSENGPTADDCLTRVLENLYR